MSHYKPYPAYKDSGVEWLGKVPEHWDIVPLKYEAEFVNGAAFKPEQWSEEGIPIIRIENLNGSINFNHFEGEMNSRYAVQQGDLLFGWSGNRGTSFGPFIWPHEGQHYLNQHIFRICNFAFEKSWFYWTLKAVTAHVEDQAHGIIGMVHITKGDLGAIKIAAPELVEQKAIAAHLDRETTRIDALITKKTRFIELLREKRQALITHAVTKGLDPNVKMKDSGVEWLGEVPEHWSLLPLKFVSPNLTVGIVVNPTEYVADEGLPFLYGGDIGEGEIYLEKARRISAENSERNAKTKLMAGDLVTVRVGAPGVTAVVPPDCEGGNCASVMLIRKGNFDSDWLCYLMNSRVVRYQVEVVQYGAAQEQFNIGHAVDFLLPVPPGQEQRAIAYALNEEKKRVDKLLKKTQQSIELLKERRSALITAAVTGKIDLREGNQ